MDPIGATVGGLLDELVEVAIVGHPVEPSVEDVGVGEALALLALEVIEGDANVAGFAGEMLAVLGASDGPVQGGRTVAAADDNGLLCEGAKGFEHLLAEVAEVGDDGCMCRVMRVEESLKGLDVRKTMKAYLRSTRRDTD